MQTETTEKPIINLENDSQLATNPLDMPLNQKYFIPNTIGIENDKFQRNMHAKLIMRSKYNNHGCKFSVKQQKSPKGIVVERKA